MSEKTQKLYKTDTAARELAERLFKESGIEFEGEFFAHVMSTYELQQMKNGLGAGYQKQITSLEYHMKSVVDTFSAMLQMEAGERIQISEGYEDKLSNLAGELSAQQDEISEYKKREAFMAEEQIKLVKLSADDQKEIASLRQINDKNEQILAENKERIGKLSKMVADGQDAVIQKQQLEQRVSEILEISKKQAEELADAREVTESLRMAQDEQIKQLTAKHTDELSRAAERAEIAQERTVLAVRRELADQAEKERSELSKQLQASERESSAEIRKLYGEMDKLRQQLATAKQTKKSELSKLADRTGNNDPDDPQLSPHR